MAANTVGGLPNLRTLAEAVIQGRGSMPPVGGLLGQAVVQPLRPVPMSTAVSSEHCAGSLSPASDSTVARARRIPASAGDALSSSSPRSKW